MVFAPCTAGGICMFCWCLGSALLIFAHKIALFITYLTINSNKFALNTTNTAFQMHTIDLSRRC